jgi:hypothetical protein
LNINKSARGPVYISARTLYTKIRHLVNIKKLPERPPT